jgi:3-oxoacyl-[acyl-carrier protein] reductase
MRNVIVTGASRGLGLAISRRLARDGFCVLGVARRMTAELEAAQSEAVAAGSRIEFLPFDLSKLTDIRAFVTAARRAHGKVFGLVNNAALGTDGLLATMADGKIEELLRLNVQAPILLTKNVVRYMMADGEGRVVNVSSIIGFTGYSGLSVYAATKSAMLGFSRAAVRHMMRARAGRIVNITTRLGFGNPYSSAYMASKNAIWGFTQCLAVEMAPYGVTVNAVAPGFISTEMTSALDDEERDQIARRAALKRLADPDDVAAAVAYLMSDGGKNVTGTTLTVDAGAIA